MAGVDQAKVTGLISELRDAVGSLEELAGLGEAEFLADKHRVASAKYNLIVAIEAAIDLCNHAISRLGLRAPEDYADSFRVLSEQGAFAPELLESLVEMAKFRNRLVHFYFKVDDQAVARIIREDLGDFQAFLAAYGRFISG